MKKRKMTDLPGRFRRILVALDASRQSQTALEAAAEMAERMQAELEAMFVEDIDLLHLAELPFSHEIGFTSASRRLLDSTAMARALRIRASEARAMLESIAAKHKITSTFRVARGKVLEELLAATETVDMVAVGTRGHKLGRGKQVGSTYSGVLQSCRCSVLVLQENIAPGDAIVVLFDGSDASIRALELAQTMSASHHDPVVVVLLCKTSRADSLKQKAANYLGDLPDVEYRELSTSQLDELSRTLNDTKCGVFLVPRPITQTLDSLSLERLSHLRCPVMLLP
jgi:nucleotide-binding universal stress UspA family protein